MRIWTIQELTVWEALEERGVLHVDPALAEHQDYSDAYDWLSGEMRRRVGEPPRGVRWPWWGWGWYHTRVKARPDLRAIGWDLERGSQNVRIELELPEGEVLLSEFNYWHFVLMGSYLPSGGADDDAFIEDMDAFDEELERAGVEVDRAIEVEPFRTRIIASWERIFVVYDNWPTQATFWELRMDQVQDVTHFVGRRR